MLTSVSDIADLFSVFHDGEIMSHQSQAGDLRLRLDVEYLAKRIQPTFQCFEIELLGVKNLEFTTWPEDEQAPRQLHKPEEIFIPRLEVLSGETEGSTVRVVCNQPASRVGWSGGDLRFEVRGARVRDEAGLEWSIENLKSLAEAYWAEWSERGKRNAT
jgi:hypothetical protein